MKYLIFLGVLVCCFAARCWAQDTINPYNISQPMTIELHNTDVYYKPFTPPASTDTRAGLSCMANKILDSNGIFENGPYFRPVTHGTYLYQYAPYGVALKNTAWQRLFTARRRPDGTTTDIIAGGDTGERVIISANDFRASGRVILKSGFHAKPGCFFHAYTEPQWKTVVFSDNFDSINRAQWYIANGSNVESGGIECLTDTNVRDTADPDAVDGHAIDIMLREILDTCSCQQLQYSWMDTCNGSIDTESRTPHKSVFSSALVRSCPWPMADRIDSLPFSMAYQHMPYGKYEIREKTPHTLHHINNWLFGSFEVDMNEEAGNDTSTVTPSVHRFERLGPYTGSFHILSDSTVIFVSTDANWSLVNQPLELFIDNFAYDVALDTAAGHCKDTIIGKPLVLGGITNWPASLKYSTKPVTFYYSQNESCIADTVPWKITQDPASHEWRIFSAPYRLLALGDSSRFTKSYQPYQIRLTYDTAFGIPVKKIFHCHWANWLNTSSDTGRLWLDDTGIYVHSYREPYPYWTNSGFFEYKTPSIPYEWGDTSPSSYRYHTITVEIVPNEIRFLYDSNVVVRVPDRLVPPDYPQYDYLQNLDRSPMQFYIGELDMDRNGNGSDPFGTDSIPGDNSTTYQWRHMFERGSQDNWAGFWPYHGQPTAHKLIDYVKVWDVPADVTIPDFPH